MSLGWQDEEARRDAQAGTMAEPSPAREGLSGVDERAPQPALLPEENERLPWLEAEDDYEDERVDTARIVLVAVIGLLLVLGIVGAAWWLSREAPGADLLPEGSVIAAPEEPFRIAPEEAGGAQVAGTGDLSFEVAEGERREARLADGAGPGAADAAGAAAASAAAAAAPVPAASASASAPASARAPASAAPAATRPTAAAAPAAAPAGVGVQVGAYSTRAAAQNGWSVLTRQNEVLSGVQHRILEAQVDGATIFRLQAVPGSLAAAEELCRALKAGGTDCQVKR